MPRIIRITAIMRFCRSTFCISFRNRRGRDHCGRSFCPSRSFRIFSVPDTALFSSPRRRWPPTGADCSLEKSLAGELDLRIGKPDSEEQGEQDLRDEVTDPQNDGLPQCFEKTSICRIRTVCHAFTEKNCRIVVHSDPVADIGLVALEGQDKCVDQRPNLEKAIHKEKRCNEHISIFGVADRFNSTLCYRSHRVSPSQYGIKQVAYGGQNAPIG